VIRHRGNEDSRKLEKVPIVGSITGIAIVASAGDTKNSTTLNR